MSYKKLCFSSFLQPGGEKKSKKKNNNNKAFSKENLYQGRKTKHEYSKIRILFAASLLLFCGGSFLKRFFLIKKIFFFINRTLVIGAFYFAPTRREKNFKKTLILYVFKWPPRLIRPPETTQFSLNFIPSGRFLKRL